MPSESRGSSSIAIRLGKELLLFDCGEGTQRQMVKARIGFQREMKIFISHLHGDHILGLPGLIQSMSLLRREKKLHIFGPNGLVKFVKAFSESLGGPSFPVILHEIITPGIIFESNQYRVETIEAEHRTISWSFGLFESSRPGKFYPERAEKLGIPKGKFWHKLQHGEKIEYNGVLFRPSQVTDEPRKGRTIVYSGDTAPSRKLVKLAKNADLLIHEATFLEDQAERAKEDGHSTALQAAKIASEANVECLLLTHISSRYPESKSVLKEAKMAFNNVIVADDLLKIEIPLK
jgi:ribonuclease Z